LVHEYVCRVCVLRW